MNLFIYRTGKRLCKKKAPHSEALSFIQVEPTLTIRVGNLQFNPIAITIQY